MDIVPTDLVCILAFDLEKGGSKLGQGTIERCLQGIRTGGELAGKGCIVEYVLAGGSNLREFPNQKYAMAEMMEAKLELLYVNIRSVTALDQDRWGTCAELEKFLQYAHDLMKAGIEPRVHIVSHWWHVPRLRMICRKLDLKCEFHAAQEWHWSALQEIYKIPGEGLRLFSPRFGRLVARARGRS